MKVCYLGGPVDFTEDNGRDWREDFKRFAKEQGSSMSFYDPPAAFSFTEPNNSIASFLFEVNMVALRKCGIMLVRWDKRVPSVGTPIEIYEAFRAYVPVVMVTNLQESLTIRHFAHQRTNAGFEILGLDTPDKVVLDTLCGMYDSTIRKAEKLDMSPADRDALFPSSGVEDA